MSTPPRSKREAVLIALHGDGFVEVFGEKNVDVKIMNVPHCPGSEILAEDTFELMLRHRYRQLYWPNKVRASAMHRPLLPTTMAAARQAKNDIATLNRLGAA